MTTTNHLPSAYPHLKKMFKGHKMIAKKQRKNNKKKATTKPYNLNDVPTKKKAKQAVKPKENGALNLFFSLIGFVGVVGGLALVFVPTIAEAKETIIVEKFDCNVALADFSELQRRLDITPRTDFKYPLFLDEYEAVSDALTEHRECEGVNNGK